jgi:Wax ester synthase-like Acyl-CoA acyltransferase domain
MFESDLDRHTVEQFFEKLCELFPKYNYKVELDPGKAAKLDKDAQKHLAGDSEKGASFSGEGQQKRKEVPDPGRKTRYAKGLKAGGPLRPAKWRILDDFDVRENIEEETVSPPNNSDDRLFEIAGKFLERHFNYAKPLWEAKLVHGLNTHDGSKSALMIKM